MLKPQKIKDQEFPVKLRGYDPIEVRNYLEIVADEFFDLTERNRSLQDELETLKLNTLSSVEKRGAPLDEFTGISIGDSDAEQIEHHDSDAEEARITALTNDNITYLTRIKELKAELEQEKAKNKSLVAENEVLQKEEVSFKKTILAAQTFADNLKKSAEEEAERIIEKAKDDVDVYLLEMDKKAEYLPAQVAELEQRKDDVRRELKAVLEGYLAVLDLEGLSDELSENKEREDSKNIEKE